MVIEAPFLRGLRGPFYDREIQHWTKVNSSKLLKKKSKLEKKTPKRDDELNAQEHLSNTFFSLFYLGYR
ncbi:hypothetical protein T265_05800 [Opisthorchis viverrini]|uniref:Uncharacterized protein n=1 Tax=Opisthorchis viverrini TaxID=6198 RepID=A0A075AEV8_OPIVI|nr:hypothetical protein T265_05800 [Opisthorchis viverrini]KER27109.1 hypothetical protein T265_05800 [Opisthorchis viverrini]